MSRAREHTNVFLFVVVVIVYTREPRLHARARTSERAGRTPNERARVNTPSQRVQASERTMRAENSTPPPLLPIVVANEPHIKKRARTRRRARASNEHEQSAARAVRPPLAAAHPPASRSRSPVFFCAPDGRRHRPVAVVFRRSLWRRSSQGTTPGEKLMQTISLSDFCRRLAAF